VLRAHPWLDEVIVYNRKRAPWSFVSFLGKIRRGRFDLVIDLQRHLKSGGIAWASGAPERLGFAANNTKEYNHLFSTRQIAPQPNMRLKLAQYQAFGDALGIPPAPIEFGLGLALEGAASAKRFLVGVPRPMVGVIMGSSWPSRIYPPVAVATVIRELARSAESCAALFPVLIGGPDEAGLAAAVIRELEGEAVLNLVGRTSLRDLAAIFAECAVAFGPDSGPMHIAAAVACPIVSLWGSTAPERSAPWGYADLAIRGEIPCHPCYLRRCPIGGECMRRIAPSAVVQAVRRASATPVHKGGPQPELPAMSAAGPSR
jgi:ADP-heptose:LPS heptosyltransferase